MLPTSSRALAQSRGCCCASIAARTAATAASLALARSSATGTGCRRQGGVRQGAQVGGPGRGLRGLRRGQALLLQQGAE